jgi:hypothetical protein
MARDGDQVFRITSALGKSAARQIASLSLAVHEKLVAAPIEGGTPVDTGWASANWTPSVGAPNPQSQPENPTSGDVAAARGKAIQGQAQVLQYRLGQGSVFISNAAPYIGYLNNGSSQQAPAGFVQRAIANAVREESRAR